MRYYILPLDTETGGIGVDKSLLTLYMCLAYIEDGVIHETPLSLNLLIKPNDGIYKVTGTAMGINKINLVEHDKAALSEKSCGTMLYEFLKLCSTFSNGDKLIPVGHNVAFDVKFIKEKLISEGSWDKYVSYRCIDTCSVSQFLRICGKLPATLSCSTDSLGQYFNLPVDNLHSAEFDTKLTMGILQKLLEIPT